MRTDIRSTRPRPKRIPRPWPPAARLPALAAACGCALLLACTSSSTGPEALDGEPVFIGDYTVSGDTLFLRRPSDTDWNCEGDPANPVPVPEVREPDPDTSLFAIDGGTLRLYYPPEDVYAEFPSQTVVAVKRRFLDMARVGGGRGLEGRWQVREHAYEILSGTLEGSAKARRESEEEFFRTQLRYLTIEYEFAGGRARGRLGGDFAGFYLAEWNGDTETGTDTLDTPDSAEYDVRAVRLNSGTVRLTGGKTGETVTVTFVGPTRGEHFASDNPAHPAYLHEDVFRSCGMEDWFHEFLDANRKVEPILKRGRERGGVGRERLENSPFSKNFDLRTRLPLKQPHSLLN